MNTSSYIHECKFAQHLFEVHVLGRAFERLNPGGPFILKHVYSSAKHANKECERIARVSKQNNTKSVNTV